MHRIACLMLLCASHCFDTAKVEEPLYLDTARPDRHTPLFCGVSAAPPGGDQSLLFRLPPQPQKVFGDSRVHTVGDLLEGFDQPLPTQLPPGHDADLFSPDYAVSNLAALNQQQGQECLPPILLLWVGVNTGCWHPVLTPTNMSRNTGRCQHWVLAPCVDTY